MKWDETYGLVLLLGELVLPINVIEKIVERIHLKLGISPSLYIFERDNLIPK